MTSADPRPANDDVSEDPHVRNEPHEQREEAVVAVVRHEARAGLPVRRPDQLAPVHVSRGGVGAFPRDELDPLGVVAEVVVVARLFVEVQLQG